MDYIYFKHLLVQYLFERSELNKNNVLMFYLEYATPQDMIDLNYVLECSNEFIMSFIESIDEIIIKATKQYYNRNIDNLDEEDLDNLDDED